VGRAITKSIRDLAQTFAGAFDPYRPELHYMRGRGPKWHAKWADNTTQGPSPVVLHTATDAGAAAHA